MLESGKRSIVDRAGAHSRPVATRRSCQHTGANTRGHVHPARARDALFHTAHAHDAASLWTVTARRRCITLRAVRPAPSLYANIDEATLSLLRSAQHFRLAQA